MSLTYNLNLPELDGVLLNKLLRPDSIKRSVKIIQLSLLALSAIILILLIKSSITGFLQLSSSISEAELQIEAQFNELAKQSQTAPINKSTANDLLPGRGLFGDIGVKIPQTNATPTPDRPVAPPKPLQITLVGTFLTAGASPFAIIENKRDGSQEPFNKGDQVFDEAELVSIFSDRVEVKRNGQIEVLKLDDTPDASDSSPATASGSAASELVYVPEAELNQALENLPLLLTQARAVPYFKDGQSVGLRLFAIKTGSMYEKIGLKNGDILKSINGNSLSDITQAIKLFENLREQRSITLDLERNRQDQTVKYEIR